MVKWDARKMMIFLNKISSPSHCWTCALQFGHVNYSPRERDTLVCLSGTRVLTRSQRSTFSFSMLNSSGKYSTSFHLRFVLRIMTRHSTLSWKKSTLVRSPFHFWPQDFSLNRCRNTCGIADDDGAKFQCTVSNRDYSCKSKLKENMSFFSYKK